MKKLVLLISLLFIIILSNINADEVSVTANPLPTCQDSSLFYCSSSHNSVEGCKDGMMVTLQQCLPGEVCKDEGLGVTQSARCVEYSQGMSFSGASFNGDGNQFNYLNVMVLLIVVIIILGYIIYRLKRK